MLKSRVVHCKKEPYDVYIGRGKGGKWGNPFVIGRDGTRDEVIKKYVKWLRTQPHLVAALPELKGKVLGCWCAPSPCHGDALVALSEGCDPPNACATHGRCWTHSDWEEKDAT